MRTLIGMGVLLLSCPLAVAEEPPTVSPAPVGAPMQIAPAVIGQPMIPQTPDRARSIEAADAPQLLVAPPEAGAAPEPTAEPAPVQVAGTNP